MTFSSMGFLGKIRLLPFFLLIAMQGFAQSIPPMDKIDWTHAGLEDTLSIKYTVITMPINKGVTDITSTLLKAIQSLAGNGGIIYLPAGKYLITQTIALNDHIILRGAGSDSTELIFKPPSGEDHCFSISRAQPSSFTPLPVTLLKGCHSLPLSAIKGIKAGDFLELRESNGGWDILPAPWAKNVVGQIIHVKAVSDSIYFSQPLRIQYDSVLKPEIREITPVTGVGIEALTIMRADSGNTGHGNNIFMRYAANCWVRGVESIQSRGAHLLADACSHILVTGCYMHKSYAYDGVNTAGYGITLINHTDECLIENNIFATLRHAMMVKQGANGNVFGYNFSTDVTRTEFPTNASGDISLHGHYPFANLFEGNIVQNISLDMTWGPAGPYNTFLRNRAELYGIIMSNGSVNAENEAFIGNEITGDGPFQGNYLISSRNYTYGNNVKGNYKPRNIDSLSLKSLYLKRRPSFWNIHSSWPSISLPNALDSGTIPAKERYYSAADKTVYYALPTAAFTDSISCDSQSVILRNSSSIAQGSLVKYLWHFGDGDTSTLATLQHYYHLPGTYILSLKVTSDKGMKDSLSRTINILPKPQAHIAFHTSDSIRYSFTITDTVLGLHYFWDFGDGTTSIKDTTSHTFQQPGSYQIALTISNGHCSRKKTFQIKVTQHSNAIVMPMKEKTIAVYPNPTNSNLHIDLLYFNKATTLEIRNDQGRLVFSKKITQPNNLIPFHYPKGLYILRIIEGHAVYYSKIIMQ